MKYVDEFRDREMVRDLAEQIRRTATRPMTFMEVCGTHTMAIARYGIKSLLPPLVRLISGPGCPVCVTPEADIDRFIALGQQPGVILTSFGDMLRVPGSATTLEAARAHGADVRVVYSPLDAVALAEATPDRQVVFCGVGFETTTPAIALAVLEAQRRGVSNFLVLASHKVIPQAMVLLASDPEIGLNGFLCPGHVSAILGSEVYEPLARDYGMPCAIAGFEPLDILQAIHLLVQQVEEGRAAVEVPYNRVVAREGNQLARAAVDTVFAPEDAEWRGLGVIPGTGLRLRPAYAAHDATRLLPEMPEIPKKPSVCECGNILKGIKSPAGCRAFGTGCTPEHPIGPCMVSSEGACAAAYRYGGV